MKIIDLEKDYGVVMGRAPLPPLNDMQYHTGEQNRIGIQKAIDDAHDEGHTNVSFKKFHTFIGYKMSGRAQFATHGDELIILRTDTEYDFLECKIEVMFDSINKSPYHINTGSYQKPYELRGSVISFRHTKNTTLKNLEIIGEVYKRSWVKNEAGNHYGGSEAAEEQCNGITQSTRSYNSKVLNCNVHGFAGGSVHGAASNNMPVEDVTVATAFKEFYKGDWDKKSKAIIKAISGTYIGELKKINLEVLNNPNNLSNDEVVFIAYPGNGTLYFQSEFTTMLWFNDVDDCVGESIIYNREPFVVPTGATHLRLRLHNVKSDEDVWVYPAPSGIYYADLKIITNRGILLDNCIFANAHRGAVANLHEDFTIQNCTFKTNGKDSGIGAPLFPDTTRFQIDIEDVNVSGGKILNNRFFDGPLNGILVSSDNVQIDGNIMMDSGGIGLYARTLNASVTNNKVYGGSFAIQNFGTEDSIIARRKFVVTGNHFTAPTSLSLGKNSLHNTDFIISNNFFTGNNFSISDIGEGTNSIISNNIFRLTTGVGGGMYNVSYLRNVKNFHDNIIYKDIHSLDLYRCSLHIGHDVIGTGNRIKGVKLKSGNWTYSNDPKFRLKGFILDNCEYHSYYSSIGKDVPLEIENFYEDCSFVGTHPEFINVDASGQESLESYKLRFDDCDFEFEDAVPHLINGGSRLINSADYDYSLRMNNCKLKTNADKIFIIGNNRGIKNANVRMSIKDLKTDNKVEMFQYGNNLKI